MAGSLSLSAFLGWAWISDRTSRRQWRKSWTPDKPPQPKSVWR